MASPRQYKCAKCNVVFKHQPSYSRHVQTCGESCKSNLCKICKKGFNRKDAMVRHIQETKMGAL